MDDEILEFSYRKPICRRKSIRRQAFLFDKKTVAMPLDEFLDTMSIAELELCVRTTISLEKNGIRTVRQLISHSIDDLLDLPKIGFTGCQQIRKSLSDRGLTLHGD